MEYIWGDKPRSVTDSTRIDDAIREAIQAHNDDPEAHLGPGQSLETHRESEVIDHQAESIVNDKLLPKIREYTAIVDSESESDFDTIQSAIEYVSSLGGGKILIMPGDYYISGAVDLPVEVSLVGLNRDTCKIRISPGSANYLRFITTTYRYHIVHNIKDLTFISNGIRVFSDDEYPDNYEMETIFENCKFTGNGTYISSHFRIIRLNNCDVRYNGVTPICVNNHIYCKDTTFEAITGTAGHYIFDCSQDDPDAFYLYLDGCKFYPQGLIGARVYNSDNIEDYSMNRCSFNFIDPTYWDFRPESFTHNFVALRAGTRITFSPSRASSIDFSYNTVTSGATPNLVINGDDHYIVLNKLKGNPTNNGARNYIFGNQIS